MYSICVETSFSSAHRLVGYEGNCERIHGHNWIIKAIVKTKKLDDTGIGYDFRILKKLLNNIVDKYDHQMLNEIPPFDSINPTSENIAKIIFESLKSNLPDSIYVGSVEVKESEKCSIIYSED